MLNFFGDNVLVKILGLRLETAACKIAMLKVARTIGLIYEC